MSLSPIVESKDAHVASVGAMINQVFSHAEKPIRVIGTFIEPWFCASDLAKALGYKDTDDAIRNHVKDDACKSRLGDLHVKFNPGWAGRLVANQKNAIYVNETAMYRVIFRSSKPGAVAFQQWICSEVIPSIRKTGQYALNTRVQELEATVVRQLTMGEDAKREVEQAKKEAARQAIIAAKAKRQAEKEKMRRQEMVERANKFKRDAEMQKHKAEVANGLINHLYTQNIDLLSYKKFDDGAMESVYILSTETYMQQGIYKIGRTKSMKSRKPGHNNTRVSDDKVIILAEFKVHDAALIEKYLHEKLSGVLMKGEQEFFMLPYAALYPFVSGAIDHDRWNSAAINQLIDRIAAMRQCVFDATEWMPAEAKMRYAEDEPIPADLKLKLQEGDNKEYRLDAGRQAINSFISDQLGYQYDIGNEADLWLKPMTISMGELIAHFKKNIAQGKRQLNKPDWSALLRGILAASPNFRIVT